MAGSWLGDALGGTGGSWGRSAGASPNATRGGVRTCWRRAGRGRRRASQGKACRLCGAVLASMGSTRGAAGGASGFWPGGGVVPVLATTPARKARRAPAQKMFRASGKVLGGAGAGLEGMTREKSRSKRGAPPPAASQRPKGPSFGCCRACTGGRQGRFGGDGGRRVGRGAHSIRCSRRFRGRRPTTSKGRQAGVRGEGQQRRRQVHLRGSLCAGSVATATRGTCAET